MPKEFESLRNKIAGSLKGKTNPKTHKPYSESDIYAIATAQWKKSHGGESPSHGKEIYKELSFKEDDEKNMYVTGYLATSHPDRAALHDDNLDLDYEGDIIPRSTIQKIVDKINNNNLPQTNLISNRHDWIKQNDESLPVAGIILKTARVVDLPDGESAAEIDVKVNKTHPKYEDIKYNIENGFYPGFSIEYDTKDYSVFEKEGQLYRSLDDIELNGGAFASHLYVANPKATINNKDFKEIEIKELMIKTMDSEEESDMVECPKCKKKMQKDKMKSHMDEKHGEIMKKEQNEVNKMEQINNQTSALEEIKQPTQPVFDDAKIKEMVDLKTKEIVDLKVKEAMEAFKPLLETKSRSRMETKEVKEYREALEAKKLSFKEANEIVNKSPWIFDNTFRMGESAFQRKYWETDLKDVPGPFGNPTIHRYSDEMAKIKVKEMEVKAALLAFNSPTNDEATYYQAPAELGDFYNPVIVSHMNDNTVLFGILPKEDWSDRQSIQFRVITGNPTAAGYLEGDSTWTSTNVTRVKFQQDYANYRSIVEVTGQMLQAAQARNGVGDVFGQEVERATIALYRQINSHILTGAAGTYNGTSGDAILGLQHLILTSGNLYGKARGTYSTLQGQTTAASSAAITLNILRTMIQNVLVKGGTRKENLVFVTSYTQERFLRNIFEKQNRTVPMTSAFGLANVLEFEGIPIFPDSQATAGDCFLLDLSHLKLAMFQAPVLTEFGITGDTRKAFIKVYLQLYNDKPENIYGYTGLATA